MQDTFVVTKERFNGFSDAVFAIAVTLLVLKFQLPALPERPTTAQELSAVLSIWPQYLVYIAGFLTIGIVWLNHNAMFRYVDKITHGMAIMNLMLLLFVALLPLPTAVLARFGPTRLAVVGYGLVLSVIAISAILLNAQILAAHAAAAPRALSQRLRRLMLYPLATILGYFFPVVGLVTFALLSIAALLPQSIATGMMRPEDKGEPAA